MGVRRRGIYTFNGATGKRIYKQCCFEKYQNRATLVSKLTTLEYSNLAVKKILSQLSDAQTAFIFTSNPAFNSHLSCLPPPLLPPHFDPLVSNCPVFLNGQSHHSYFLESSA